MRGAAAIIGVVLLAVSCAGSSDDVSPSRPEESTVVEAVPTDDSPETVEAESGSIEELIESGADCGELFAARNDLEPDDPYVSDVNEMLRFIGCYGSGSTRTDR